MSDRPPSPARLWRKIYWRIIPVVSIAWLCSSIDRGSLGYVAVPLSKDLGLSATNLGFAAGIVFVGYIVVPVPGNLVQYRVGARTWITGILIAWSLVTAATATVDSAATLYLARILLGLAEGGIGSGILLYLTSWLPRSQQSRALSYFFLVIPVSGSIGALLAGFLLSQDGLVPGLAGWRSVFLTEGILSLLAAALVWFTLTSKPQDASWLTGPVRQMLRAELGRDAASAQAATVTTARAPLRDRRVWALVFANFAISFGVSPLAFFLPKMITVVQHSLHNTQAVLITVIPQLIAAVVMITWARLARRRAPVITTIIPVVAAAVAMAVAAYASNGVIFVSAVCVATAGSYSAIPQFWRLPSLRLSGPAAAAGIALIVSGANVSAFAGPYVTGYVEDLTGNFRDTLLLITVIMLLGAFTIAFTGRSALRSPTEGAEAETIVNERPAGMRTASAGTSAGYAGECSSAGIAGRGGGPGHPGGLGTRGTPGGPGGSGGVSMQATITIQSTLTGTLSVFSQSGAGGRDGNGGQGGPGQQGGNGGNGVTCDCTGNGGGQGGDGGTGGAGGVGGAGVDAAGNVVVMVPVTNDVPKVSTTTAPAPPGAPGTPGPGGGPGAGGNGGGAGKNNSGGSNGRAGAYGASGAQGKPGTVTGRAAQIQVMTV